MFRRIETHTRQRNPAGVTNVESGNILPGLGWAAKVFPAPTGSCVAWRHCPTQPDLSCPPEPAQKLGRPPREGAFSLGRPERRGADFPEPRGGNHGAFDEAVAPLMAPRKGWAGCPGGAPRTWGVSHPRSPAETPATPAAGLGGSGARTARAARTRAVPSANKRPLPATASQGKSPVPP